MNGRRGSSAEVRVVVDADDRHSDLDPSEPVNTGRFRKPSNLSDG
jgi:hypothetical protein